ncbi:hypothetical protein AKJ09_10258 [Labilithrix luteola]|uniref:FHA domain-containing protein n=1 Tax=Labilithrix luteola TaxID=1391654 RepID=A0A0K1QDT3_9BACT|nr:hypothetical protein [Labilithrix luteola]AKV03595.1 hypothetical protein AKJ09_10258 [Labilithrix luteola]
MPAFKLASRFAQLGFLACLVCLALSTVGRTAEAHPATGHVQHASEPECGVCQAQPPPPPPEPVCEQDCFVLDTLSIRGAVAGTLSFELHGSVRAKGEQKIPLFGPPSQVRLEDVTLDGAHATIGFDGDHYVLLTSGSKTGARTFTLRGRLALGSDQILSVSGPLVSLDAHLTKGRLVEGDRLSGLQNTVLHFDPLSEEEGRAEPSRARVPSVFRLARSLRFGNETSFVYRLVASQATDLGVVRLPLKYGEKVQDVQGSTGWQAEGQELLLPTTGHEAEITIAGTLPAGAPNRPVTFKGDERAAYEWWMIESDPEHRVAVGGEPKLVETSQSPIPPIMPGARVYLVQRGQELEVDARSLVRGDVLAAVVRNHNLFVAITGRGELISDETVSFDNNGLDHLMLTPAGKAMYLSTDGTAQRILHTTAGAKDVLVPIRTGPHTLRVQSLSEVKFTPFLGALGIPSSSYALTTSNMDVTVGLPDSVYPIAVLGGDRLRTAFSSVDVFAVLLGVSLACFGFRTKKTRILGALATAGLWFVSHDGFVFATGTLFTCGAIFLASRFVRGAWLPAASGAIVIVALLVGREAMTRGGKETIGERYVAMLMRDVKKPSPETSYPPPAQEGSLETKAGVTPVSLSVPSSDLYVLSSRQLVTRDRPFVPRVLYVTSSLLAILHVAWLALVGALVWAHRERLAQLKQQIVARLGRRPEPKPIMPPREAPPF